MRSLEIRDCLLHAEIFASTLYSWRGLVEIVGQAMRVGFDPWNRYRLGLLASLMHQGFQQSMQKHA